MLQLNPRTWYYTQAGTSDQADAGLSTLAYQDTFIRMIPQLQDPSPSGILHFYQNLYPTVILGPKDNRLSRLDRGLAFLQEKGYAVHLRAHGGLAVVADPGVLNISYIVDNQDQPLSIDQAYQAMVDWVSLAFEKSFGVTVTAKEIPQSYCPGTYDLVIEGQKIGGIAQRRFKSGLTTAAYLSITGDQEGRCHLIRDFYLASDASDAYPKVDASVMANLDHFVEGVSIDRVKLSLLSNLGQQQAYQALTTIDQPLYEQMLVKSQQRNQTLNH